MSNYVCNQSLIHLYLQLKKILSSIPETMLNVECLMNDVDVSSKMTREIFEEKSQHILERVKLPLQKVVLAFLTHLSPRDAYCPDVEIHSQSRGRHR